MKVKIFISFLLLAIFISAAVAQSTSGTKIVTADDAKNNALNVGAKIPSFSLSDSTGKIVKSRDLFKSGNLVIVFYRGAWCPFCNTYLRSLQKRLTDINAAGGTLIAISVENPDTSMQVSKKNEVAFTVLSDPNLDTARKFGIVYELPPETNAQYKSYGIDLATKNSMSKPELPLSATYVVDRKGKIRYAFLEPDYKKRAEPDVIVEELTKLKKPAK